MAALLAWRNELAAAMLPLFADLGDADIEVLRRAVAILHGAVEASEGDRS